ncbi:MAG TPA: alpha-galactosidase [Candidatus Limiplasma sp.]|nr:alpha-galactosidase [Candidatus Limiplasma sp.]
MISVTNGEFRLQTARSSYWFRVTPYGHLEHVYYGERLPENQPMEPLALKRNAQTGGCVLYNPADETYCLDMLPLEWSGIGKGDYRNPPAEIKMPDQTFTADFRYQSHTVTNGSLPMQTLPSAYGDADACQTLTLTLLDESNRVTLLLHYTVFEATDVIARRATLVNGNENPLVIRRLMSLQVDLPNDGYRMITLDGGWIKETHRHERPVTYGLLVNESITGDSSNRHNPGFLLAAEGATETSGRAYGFNLVYSGNHYGAVELSAYDLVRVSLGISPHCFEWTLQQCETFETPEAVMSFSAQGLNGLSQQFHDFVNRHIVRGDWQGKERPVLLNNWEAYFFKFTRGKLLRLARRAKKVGVELFVLDDGWFGKRDSDRAGLGDYTVNRRKLSRGLSEFSSRIHGMGLMFGLWFEPEMVNPDSDLYRAHPEYALATPGKEPALGRNQLVLDLCNPAVRDYIVENVTRILDTCNIDYVKWDYNRHISDACSKCLTGQGEFFHRYMLGLYDVLTRVFRPRPGILFESCSSGGNRFDLGMLCFSPQIWSSDDTDPIERLSIQGGLSLLYPLSTMGAHVSEAPHQQTLRDTPLSTRFNVAAFGCLGYELDLKYLTHVQRREVKEQIAFYKRYRALMQYGVFYRSEPEKPNKAVWHCVARDGGASVSGFFQTQTSAAEGFDRLRLTGLKQDGFYQVETKPQNLAVKRFGSLIRHILPIAPHPDGLLLRLANRYYRMQDCVEHYRGYGSALMNGILLNNQFIGSGYSPQIRMLGDFGSNLYVTESADPDSRDEKPIS